MSTSGQGGRQRSDLRAEGASEEVCAVHVGRGDQRQKPSRPLNEGLPDSLTRPARIPVRQMIALSSWLASCRVARRVLKTVRVGVGRLVEPAASAALGPEQCQHPTHRPQHSCRVQFVARPARRTSVYNPFPLSTEPVHRSPATQLESESTSNIDPPAKVGTGPGRRMGRGTSPPASGPRRTGPGYPVWSGAGVWGGAPQAEGRAELPARSGASRAPRGVRSTSARNGRASQLASKPAWQSIETAS